jgi:DNA-binding NarL/FixJ family response regulator
MPATDEDNMRKPIIRLLIADDRLGARVGLRALLATCSQVEVVGEAADGQEAVRLVRQHSPEVVLMDVRMPGVDGLEATRILKREAPSVRVVVLTLYGSYRGEALAAGADAFLLKGCATDELLAAIASPPLQHSA